MVQLKKVFTGHLFVFMIFVLSLGVRAKTYYVDSEKGNDGNPGTSIDSAWSTIEKVNSFDFVPGDSILFRRGSVWREELNIKWNGDSSNFITVGAYGKGKKPVILGSEALQNWEKVSPNVWKALSQVKGNWLWFVSAGSIFWGRKKTSFNDLNSERDFYIDDSLVYVYSFGNPSGKFKSIELSVREFGIISGWYGEGAENIIIENFEILFTIDSGIRIVDGKNWIIKNCISHHNGATDESNGQGIQYEGGNGLFSNNILYENGQHGFYLSAFGNAKVENNTIERNTVYNNYHTGIDIMNNGDSVNILRNTVIRYNKVYDNLNFNGKEVGIQLYAFNGGKIKQAGIYYNILFNTKGIGISIQDNTDSVFVYNNTVYQPESTCFTLENDSGYVELINNIGIGDEYYALIFIHNPANKLIDYNCWFRNDGNLVWVSGKYYSQWGNYVNGTGFDRNGINADPQLNLKTFKLKDTSPCINAGKYVGLDSDFWGNEIVDEKIDIGACECY